MRHSLDMVKKKKLLITGASGFLGWRIIETAASHWDIYGICHHNSIPGSATPVIMDITNTKDVTKLFKEIQPDAVIHTAAASNPNYCQLHPGDTWKINVDTSLHLAKLCAAYAIPIIFTSTDLVFDGLTPPYSEKSPVNPINIYSEQKVIAEEKMALIYPKTTICRLPLLFGYSGSFHQNFTKNMIMALINGTQVDLFSDEYRSPVDVQSASKGLLFFLTHTSEIIHLGGHKRISRYQMGIVLADLVKCDHSLIRSIRQNDRPMHALRPKDVSLDSSKAMSLGYSPDTLETALTKTIRNMGLETILQNKFPE